MKILIICPQLPYPLTDGGRQGVFYPIKYLASRGHSVHLICISDVENKEAEKFLKNYCTLNIIPHTKKPKVSGALFSLFKSLPYDVKRFHSDDMNESVKHALSSSSYDIVQVEGIHAAYYGLEIKKTFNIPVVMRAHNIHALNLLRFVPQIKNPITKLYLAIEARKVKKYEINTSQRFNRVLTVSEIDRNILLSWNDKIRCDVVEAGVEIDESRTKALSEHINTILWMGALRWKPNQDSLLWFIDSILPEIVHQKPGVKVYVVGSNPPKKIAQIRHPNVDMIGTVDDVKPYLKRAEVCVVPLRIGSGIRLKILEMFSMKKPVVSTSVGCEGLPVKDGEHLLVADEPNQFADAVVKLFDEPALRVKLGKSGFQLVKKQYSWNRIAEKLENIYTNVMQEHNKLKKQ